MVVRTTPARQLYTQQTAYISTSVTFADNGTAKTVGVLPAGAVIKKAESGITVTEAFDAGTTNTVNIGTSADDNLYGTALAAGATDFVPLDEAVSYKVDSDTTITASVALSGTAATAGSAEVVVAYYMP